MPGSHAWVMHSFLPCFWQQHSFVGRAAPHRLHLDRVRPHVLFKGCQGPRSVGEVVAPGRCTHHRVFWAACLGGSSTQFIPQSLSWTPEAAVHSPCTWAAQRSSALISSKSTWTVKLCRPSTTAAQA